MCKGLKARSCQYPRQKRKVVSLPAGHGQKGKQMKEELGGHFADGETVAQRKEKAGLGSRQG